MTGVSTKGIHGADHLARVPDVVPPINISATFRYDDDPDTWVKAEDGGKPLLDNYLYSRVSHPNSEQVEAIVEQITGYPAVVYSGGMPAYNAALTYYDPKTIAIGHAYHGCRGLANLWTQKFGTKQISIDDEFGGNIGQGDLVHLESPVNPWGTAIDIQAYADRAHKVGAIVLVDATFAPPPIQDPFQHGADIVLHSATKYFGGHSDLLAGLLLVKDAETKNKLVKERVLLGTNIGSLEAAFLLRSLRTFDLRVERQWRLATAIAQHLNDNIDKLSKLTKVYHSSLQTEPFVAKQLVNGHSPVLSIEVTDEATAKLIPGKLKYFIHAVSLGGVESSVHWRVLSDKAIAPNVIRISVGVENVDDLIADLDQALT